MHNSTDRFPANHEASLVTQIIRLTCASVEHRNCDISPSLRLLQVASPPMWAYTNCDISSSLRLLQVASPPMWAYTNCDKQSVSSAITSRVASSVGFPYGMQAKLLCRLAVLVPRIESSGGEGCAPWILGVQI
ncbi:hypothetical protein PoB_001187700 [Plakobranchus ocellatus]|uniref:Uncharacterized protein n=1 Tax=Plakobranchus ocellatus TaxID=259542 RepID=A0AAV3YTA5_9GAST|nr:hypothetical protein PoB_001187700 [Plakobranchus ocellatus]